MSGKKLTKQDDIDDAIAKFEERENRTSQPDDPQKQAGKELIGRVERFFDKIDVVAIKLDAPLSVGDIIEIGTYEDAVRQRVTSMQIDRVDVHDAGKGDSVGVKLKHKVEEGSSVYRIG
jgi:hypothetical protein